MAASKESLRTGACVGGAIIDAISWDDAVEWVLSRARCRTSASVALCNVHMVVTASTDARLGEALSITDLCLPDGFPIAWFLRKTGFAAQPRISGAELTLAVFEKAAEEGIGVYLYGSKPETLSLFSGALMRMFPNLAIAGTYSPPFRALTAAEDEHIVNEIAASGAGIVLVGLGCPKQEIWMADHKGRIPAVMLGVGAAFDFHAGTIKRAPQWMRDAGLEWFHRLCSEPGRLWKRYAVTNSLFLFWVARHWFGRTRLVVNDRS